MEQESSPFTLSLNLATVVKGPVADLERLLQEIRRFVEARPEMRLVFREVSGDKLMIVRKGEMR